MRRHGRATPALIALVIAAVSCTSGAGTSQQGTSQQGTEPGEAPTLVTTATPADPSAPEGTVRSVGGTEPAPEFPDGLDWLNVDQPLSIAQLRGKVVLLDFWTYGCINCIHIIPDLERLEEEFAEELVVIGVHSAKFENEAETDNIRRIILRYGLEHPVVNDAGFTVWRRWGAQAWPTLFLVDPAGMVVGWHAGEGVYPVFAPVIRQVIEEFDDRDLVDRTPLRHTLERDGLPDTVLSFPGSVEVEGQRVFIADSNHHRIVVAGLDGEVLGVVGTGEPGLADGLAGDAAFRNPQGLGLDAEGATLFVADTGNHAVRAIDLDDLSVATVAGTGAQGGWPPQGGPALSTPLHSPWDVAATGDDVYIAMAGSHQIWRLDTTGGIVEPFAGSGREGTRNGPAGQAQLAQPSGLAVGGGLLYFTDSESSAIRSVDLVSGEVALVAGSDANLFDFGDVDGDGDLARFQHPLGVAVDGSRLLVADTYNSKIKEISLDDRAVATVAGNEAGWRDGADARFYEPGGVDVAAGMLYVADTNNHSVRVVDPDSGEVTTLILKGIERFLPTPDDERFDGVVVNLPSTDVGAGAGSIVLEISLPDGYKVNPLAPSRFEWSVEGGVATIPEDATRSVVDPALPVEVPVMFAEGDGTVTADVSLVYCEEDQESICLIELIRLVAPVVVAGSGPSTLVMPHTITLPANL